MDNQVNNDWQFILEDLNHIEQEINIKQVKLTHHYFYDNDIIEEILIEKSTEVIKRVNQITGDIEWFKKNSKVFLNSNSEKREEVEETRIDNYEELVTKINSLKLHTLKNNYFYNDEDKEDYWEVIYNNVFKIVGSYKSFVEELEILENLLEFKSPLEKSIGLIDELLINEGGDELYEI